MSYSKTSIIRKTVVLQVTESCNLNCVYCYQHSKQFNTIDESVLKQIILDSFAEENDFKELEFQFFGGEPLLCLPLIRRVCEWTWSEPRQKPYIFFATTNGVCLKDEDKEWFSQHKDLFWLGLSLDGTAEMQNRNRCNSYDKIDVDFFLRNWPEQEIKMTVSPLTLDTYAEGVIFLHEKGFRVAANLANGVDWSGKEHEKNLERELFKLVEYYLNHEDKEPIMWLDLPLFKLSKNNHKIDRWCGAGHGMDAYDVHGRIFPCHFFYSTTGDIVKGWDKHEFSDIYLNYYNHCQVKQLFNICPMCIGMAYSYSGDHFECDPNLCKLLQVFFRANAYFQSEKIKQKRSNSFTTHSAKSIVEGIHIINNLLNKNNNE